MGACAQVECPNCHKEFIVSPTMLGLGENFHCPFCDLYFPETKSPRIWKPEGSWGSGTAESTRRVKSKEE
jgi:hypothetical protein